MRDDRRVIDAKDRPDGTAGRPAAPGKKKRRSGARALAGAACMALGFLLVIGAVGLVVYNRHESDEAGAAADEAVAVIESAWKELPEGSQFVPDFILDPERDMPVIVDEDGNEYVGTLEIPALELTLPVMAEWSYPNLKIAPNRYCGTAYQVGFAICAHNYQRHFGRIKELQTGNEIFFTDADGFRFGYVVKETEVLNPWDTPKVVYADWPLTLFTCTIGGRTRMTVRCDRLEGQTGFEIATSH